MRILVTGFGPFGSIEANPSEQLAKTCGRPHHVLDVTYSGVDQWLEVFDFSGFDALLHLGVAQGATAFRFEIIAKNHVGTTPDNEGAVMGAGPIDPSLPHQLHATIWTDSDLPLESALGQVSSDAGDYLCNYLYFRSLSRFPELRIGFLHVPPVEAVPLGEQSRFLADVLVALESLPEAADIT